jgi:hypothetical protein
MRKVAEELGVQLEESALKALTMDSQPLKGICRRKVAAMMLYLHLSEIPLTYIIRKLQLTELHPVCKALAFPAFCEPIEVLLSFALSRMGLSFGLRHFLRDFVHLEPAASRDLRVAALLSLLVGLERVCLELCLEPQAVKRVRLEVGMRQQLLLLSLNDVNAVVFSGVTSFDGMCIDRCKRNFS